jgi:hypothetical protein
VRRWGAGTSAAVRLLVASDVALTGVAIAATAGVTQPRASQILTRLAAQQAVQAGADGYIGDRGRLLDLYLARSKPHLVEPETYWYSTRPLEDQAQRLVAVAASHSIGIAFSADLGPDLIAPWRHPTLTVAYADSLLPADEAGLVPAEGRGDASLILRWTSDPTLLSPSPPWATKAAGLPIVDPCQQWRDLHDLGGEDRAEAAGRLRTAILERSIARTP